MGAFVATTILNTAALSPRAAKLLAFFQEKADYSTGISFWSKAKICDALQISEATYARAMRELRTGNYVEVRPQHRENGSQTTNVVKVKRTGHHYTCTAETAYKLSYGSLKVYLQIVRQCGKGSYAISRRSLAEKCHLSMSSITRIVRGLQNMGLIQVEAETREHFLGNSGRTFNRFRIPSLSKIKAWIMCLMMMLARLASPLTKYDTPLNVSPKVIVRDKKTRVSPIAKLKEIASRLFERLRRRCKLLRIFHD